MYDRRQFVAASVASAVATTAAMQNQALADEESKSKQGNARPVTLGIMGLSRGMALASDFAKIDGVRVKCICDVDAKRMNSASEKLEKLTGTRPETHVDFREMLADPEVDALVCAAPNHWHGPATIMGCKAGKHVYVEKPCSHNPQEGEWMIQAAQKHECVVQMGTQRRSNPETIAAINKLHQGVIGDVYLSRAYYSNGRGSIGTEKPVAVPEYLDYKLWEGPAPHREYKSNIVHYNWHWRWHWGGGELANNGVHTLDLCRWGLQVDYPYRTTISGGRYCYVDDQETPDTQVVAFEFSGNRQITWQGNSCNKHNVDPFVAFFGSKGAMEIDSDGAHRVYDRANKLVDEVKGSSTGQIEHLKNFIDAVRSKDPSLLNQPITQGHRSTMLCHLGNIAYRTGESVISDENTGRIDGTPEQLALWERQYSREWEKDVTTI